MKKSILALTVLATLIIASCQTEKEPSNGSSSQHGTKYQTLSEDVLPIYHNPSLDWIHERYGSPDTPFYYTAKQAAEAMNHFFDCTVNTDSVATAATNYANANGYLDATGRMKPVADWINTAIGHEPNSGLRQVYTWMYNENGSGSNFYMSLRSMLNDIRTQDPSTYPRGSGTGEVFIMSDVYCLGKLMPAGVEAADAMGFSDGWDYATGTGGGWKDLGHSIDPIQKEWYWANSFATMYSEAVARAGK